jgi:hypothetical protein
LLVVTPLFFLGLSIASLQVIEPKYTSSTSILVQKEETLNPLVLYEMAVTIASEDRLKSFNEIIYSRSTMEMLIDSLELDEEIETELSRHRATTEREQQPHGEQPRRHEGPEADQEPPHRRPQLQVVHVVERPDHDHGLPELAEAPHDLPELDPRGGVGVLAVDRGDAGARRELHRLQQVEAAQKAVAGMGA